MLLRETPDLPPCLALQGSQALHSAIKLQSQQVRH